MQLGKMVAFDNVKVAFGIVKGTFVKINFKCM